MNLEDVIVRPKKGKIRLRTTGLNIKLRDPKHKETDRPIMQTAIIFSTLIRRSKKSSSEGTRVFSASIKDIEKALQRKVPSNPADKLPPYYHEVLDAFNRKKADQLPPHRPGIDHRIQLEKDDNDREKEAPWGSLYNMSREELLVLRKTLTELLDKNFIRVSNSPASAPVLFVTKPGGGLRFYVDYRKLNAITRKDRYPLPLIRETLRALATARWFTKVDVIAAFHKIRVAERDEWKTAFRTRYGLYEWMVTPFGLTGAPATFQRYINLLIREYTEFCTIYIDDILIYTDDTLKNHRKKIL